MQLTPPPPTHWWRPLHHNDRRAIAFMVALPTFLFVLPALFGHPAIAQDNLIQNFPLRVLTGQQLASGHLPLLNPLADSGTPLLGGMNAGSLFPLTFLFVVLPGVVAWVLNLIAVYVAAALGVFALLRWHGLRTFAALVAGVVYAYSGAMIGQLVHLGVVQGYAMLPWAVLVMFSLAQVLERETSSSWRVRVRALLPGVTGLALLWGLTFLSGEPRAIAEMQLLLLVVGPAVLFFRSPWQPTTWSNRLVYVLSVGLALAWGAMIGLAQLITGWAFINQSQRTGLTYAWYGAGSLGVRWTSLLLIPDIFGGNGLMRQPSYFVNYNLPEVTGYAGVVALVALAGYVSRLTRRGWRGEDRAWMTYFALVVVGLFATWGNFTPVGHLFQAIPLYGSTRLQSRNIILVDLGVTVLLGWFLHRLSERDFAGAGLVGRRKWITLSPAIAVVALSGGMMFFSTQIITWILKKNPVNGLQYFERPTLALHLIVAAAVVGLLWRGLERAKLLKWLTIVIAADIVIFSVFCADGFLSGRSSIEPSRAAVVAQIGAEGRFALVDPSGANHYMFQDLGGANLNVFTKLPSVQGYGSLIDQLYGAVTDTHPLYSLDGCQLAKGVYHQLRLASVVISVDKLATLVTPTTTVPTPCVANLRSTSQRRYFGQSLSVGSVTVTGERGAAVSPGVVVAWLLNARNQPLGKPVSALGAPRMTFHFPRSPLAVGVLFSASGGALITSTTVHVRDSNLTYQLDSPFQEALSSDAWRLDKVQGPLSYFRATSVRASAWLGSHSTTSRITAIRDASWGDSWVSVKATHPTVLKRSMGWIPGWRATGHNDRTGATTTLHVVRSGLIQQVIVPPGDWTVHFHYHAPHIELGLLGSLLGGLAMLVAWFVLLEWVPRRSKARVRS
ncbi:MAG: hypothetical protein ACYC0I_01270 [Acidimicrobiales bacterium]